MNINNLPAEILGQILVFYAEDAFERLTAKRLSWMLATDDMYDNIHAEKFHDFINATLVCKRWREIALHCPGFWSNIVVGPSENTERLLARSKDHPLDVFCMLPGYEDPYRRRDALRTALNHLNRFRTFQLCFHYKYEPGGEVTSLYTPAPAPLLEELTIHYEELNSGMVEIFVKRIGCAWDAPRLRRYKVCGGRDDDLSLNSWPALQFKDTLTHLVWFPAKTSTRLFSSAEDVLSVLRDLPRLETLHIAFSTEYPVQPLSSRKRPQDVQLPRLLRLVLAGNIDTCMDILEHLTYPTPLRQFGIIAQSSSARGGDTHIGLAGFLAHAAKKHRVAAGATSMKSLRTLSVQRDTTFDEGIELMGWREVHSPLDFPASFRLRDLLSRPAFEDLDLCLSIPDYLPREYVERIFEGLSFGAVEALRLNVKIEVDSDDLPQFRRLEDDWIRFAQELVDVQTLAVGHVGVTPAWLARTLFLPTGNIAAPHGRCPYRNLRCLHVTGLTLPDTISGYDEVPQEDDDEVASLADFGDFEHFLAECIAPLVNQGINLERLVLIGPEASPHQEELVQLKTLLGAEVLCDTVYELASHGLLYRVPDTVNARWELAADELRSGGKSYEDESDESDESDPENVEEDASIAEDSEYEE